MDIIIYKRFKAALIIVAEQFLFIQFFAHLLMNFDYVEILSSRF